MRLPVGMAIWWALRPQFGTPVAVAAFLIVIAATALSYSLGADLVNLAQTRNLAVFQSFVAGSLVHVALFGVSHEHDPAHGAGHQTGTKPQHSSTDEPPDDPPGRSAGRRAINSWPYRVGLLLGLIMVVLLPHIPAG